MTVRILTGDARAMLRELPADSIACCVTSPPYFGLRDYGHADQIGLEETPEAYVDQLVEVFREVRRVLCDDGTLWLNLGDSYAGSGRGGYAGGKSGLEGTTAGQDNSRQAARKMTASRRRDNEPIPRSDIRVAGCKPKDLIGIPWMVAFALRADGWYLRQEIIWAKGQSGDDRGGAVMPESVTDRCTKAHEQVFLLSKSPRYYFDADAIAEPAQSWGERDRSNFRGGTTDPKLKHHGLKGTPAPRGQEARANRRSVWRINTSRFEGAHFATMPPALVELCLLAGSHPGDTVLDPFGGAGTTGLVADRMHRDAVLVELNPAYVELARQRIYDEAPLFAEVAA